MFRGSIFQKEEEKKTFLLLSVMFNRKVLKKTFLLPPKRVFSSAELNQITWRLAWSHFLFFYSSSSYQANLFITQRLCPRLQQQDKTCTFASLYILWKHCAPDSGWAILSERRARGGSAPFEHVACVNLPQWWRCAIRPPSIKSFSFYPSLKRII